MKKIAYLIGIIAIIIPGVAFGSSPMAFDGWSSNNGAISAGCAEGMMCGSALTDAGFFQRAVEETSTGRRYFHTIITESGQSGNAGDTTMSFSDESFVAIGRGTYGLANKQHIIGSGYSGEVTFDAENVILTGWATSRGHGTDVEFDFNQIVALGFDTGIEGKNQTFDMRQRIGGTQGVLDMGLTTSFDPPVAYSSGSYIRATWFNQDIEGQPFGWMKYDEDPYGTQNKKQQFWSFTTIAPYEFGNNMEGPTTNLVDAPFDTILN